MRRFLLGLCLIGCASASKSVGTRAAEVHERAIVVDAHNDITEAVVYGKYDFAARHEGTDTDLPRMREGGLDAELFAIWINPDRVPRERWFQEAEHELVTARERLGNITGMALARTAKDVRDNAARNVTSVLFGVEGGYMLAPGSSDEMLAHLRRFAGLGVRYLTLTHSLQSPLGGSSGDESDVQGMTDFGYRAIEEMQRLGIVVDLSHVSDPLFWDAIRVAKKPVIASHSSARTIANVPRNMTDAMLKAVGKNGGAVCVNFYPGFLDARTYAEVRHAADELKKQDPKFDSLSIGEQRKAILRYPIHNVDLGAVADHLQHVAAIAGIDHVCLGSDYDGIPLTPRGLEDVSKLPNLTAELLRRGMSEADVTKVLGGNLLRVLEANER